MRNVASKRVFRRNVVPGHCPRQLEPYLHCCVYFDIDTESADGSKPRVARESRGRQDAHGESKGIPQASPSCGDSFVGILTLCVLYISLGALCVNMCVFCVVAARFGYDDYNPPFYCKETVRTRHMSKLGLFQLLLYDYVFHVLCGKSPLVLSLSHSLSLATVSAVCSLLAHLDLLGRLRL